MKAWPGSRPVRMAWGETWVSGGEAVVPVVTCQSERCTYSSVKAADSGDVAEVSWDTLGRRAQADVRHDAGESSTSRRRHMTSDMTSSRTTMTWRSSHVDDDVGRHVTLTPTSYWRPSLKHHSQQCTNVNVRKPHQQINLAELRPRLFVSKNLQTERERQPCTVFTQRRSVAKSTGCFQRRLSVCLFVCQHNNCRTVNTGWWNLGGSCIVQKSRPSSNLVMIAPWVRTPKMWRWVTTLGKSAQAV